jgi:hypothetical protein
MSVPGLVHLASFRHQKEWCREKKRQRVLKREAVRVFVMMTLLIARQLLVHFTNNGFKAR